MRRDKIDVIAAKNRKAVASCSPVAGSCFSLSCLIVAVSSEVFSSLAAEFYVTTTVAGFSVFFGRVYSGRVTTGGTSTPTELSLVPISIIRS